MQKITNIKFISLEFDLGYSPDNEESIEYKGDIQSEIFVEIDYDGETSGITHRVKLHETEFTDFMGVEDKEELLNGINSLNDFIQVLRKIISMKVSYDLGIDLADMDYTSKNSLREDVDELKEVLDIILGGESNE